MKLVNMLILTSSFFERHVSWWLYKSLVLWYTHWRGQHTRFHKEASFSALSFKQMVLILFAEVVWYQRSSPTAEPICMTGSSRGKAVHIFTPALILFIGAAVSNSWTTEVLRDPATRTRYKKSLEMNENLWVSFKLLRDVISCVAFLNFTSIHAPPPCSSCF